MHDMWYKLYGGVNVPFDLQYKCNCMYQQYWIVITMIHAYSWTCEFGTDIDITAVICINSPQRMCGILVDHVDREVDICGPLGWHARGYCAQYSAWLVEQVQLNLSWKTTPLAIKIWLHDKWSLVTGLLALKCGTVCQKYLVLQDKWSLKTGFTAYLSMLTEVRKGVHVFICAILVMFLQKWFVNVVWLSVSETCWWKGATSTRCNSVRCAIWMYADK